VYKGLALRTEQTVKSSPDTEFKLPTNKYDYIMYHSNIPVGAFEAKRQGCLTANSVAQILVQLLLLSSETPEFFYFGVLSDADKFIFVGVSTQKVWFFQTDDSKLEIPTFQSDHMSIIEKISRLIDLALLSRKRRIEDLLNP